jgi:hypothetical protein
VAVAGFVSCLGSGLEIPPTIENTFDQHGIGGDHKRDGDAPLEPYRAQAGQQVVAFPPAYRKRRQSVAEGHDATNLGIGPTLVRAVCNVRVQPVDLTFGTLREDNAHKFL